MRIHTLWQHDGSDDVPWILDAVDEYTIENHSGLPPDYADKMKNNPALRELIIEIPEAAVRALFRPKAIKAEVVDENK
jgi:hypothetical protein